MSQQVATRVPEQAPAAPERGAAGPKRTHDCDVCVVGDGVAGLALAADLARRGRDTLLLTFPKGKPWPLDGVIAPGYGLPTADLVARTSREDAQELLILSAQAAEAGLALAARLHVEVGPRGRLTVARAHAAEALAREYVLRQALAPDTTVFVDAVDLEALLGTSAYAAGLGVVPAERVKREALRAALEADARAAGVRFLPANGALAADLKGIRKYLDTNEQRIRAFHVVIAGAEAFRSIGPKLARLPRASWVSGGFRLPGIAVPYAGMLEEVGLTGLACHFDGDRLTLAAAAASPVMTRVGAARVLRRHAAELYPVGTGLVEGAHGRWLADTGGMPVVHEGERGVWYALVPGAGALGLEFLAARLIAGALAERDDRVALLQPFAAGGLTGWSGRVARFAGYWHVRLAARLHMEKQPKAAGSEPPEPGGLPPARGRAAPASAAERARRGVAAATSASRHVARAALHAASGWASGLAARVAAEPSRRRRRAEESDDEAPPQRR